MNAVEGPLRKSIYRYTFVLLIVFLLEFIVGGLAYLYETQIETELQYTLNATFMEHYGVSEQQTKAIDSLQQEFSCCGAVRFEDWRQSVWLRSRRKDLIKPTEGRLVPDSCCITVVAKCGLRDGPSNIHYTGCIYEMTDDLKYHLIILGAIGLGLSVIQVFGMVLSCCLYVKLKDVLD
uniref:Tetraspanin n=1 Tax=Anopheles minimus TaxID=112268 RepID=A0A182W850_9DIPT